jgi:succinyl-CoA synthetase beta subunit
VKLYEFESKEIAARYGIPTPRGRVATNPQEASRVARELGPVVLKAQVLVGGRGLAGGVKIAEKPDEAYSIAKRLFSSSIRGEKVEKLLVEEKVGISRELYLSLTVDRATRRPVYLVRKWAA